MTCFRRNRWLVGKDMHDEHSHVVRRLTDVEKLARKNAVRLKRLEIEVGIFKPGPIVDENEEEPLDDAG